MLKIGVIGTGARGKALLEGLLLEMDNVKVIAVCDLYQDKADSAAKMVEEKYGQAPFKSTNYHDILAIEDIDAVIISSSWESHIQIAVDSMKAGVPCGMEVGGAYSIEDCWKLVNTYEETKTPFMMLENCCYGRRELMIQNMVNLGVFGEIVHCSGGYQHDLRKEISYGKENRHYRLKNYLNRNCENYPTHELGPIAKILKINRGNRMVSLSSFSSKSAGLKEYIKENKSDDTELMNAEFQQGDVVTTVIKCAHGETIVLTLDTTLPRYYSRGFTVRGTKGMYEEVTDSIFLDGKDNDAEIYWLKKGKAQNAEEYCEQYEHPIFRKYRVEDIIGGHDGMDWLVHSAFFDSITEGKECEIDVYDTASWMCITALSEQSLSLGGQPVAIPDFTNGKWLSR